MPVRILVFSVEFVCGYRYHETKLELVMGPSMV